MNRKKILLLVVSLFLTVYIIPQESNLKVLNEKNYRKNSNWEEVTKHYSKVWITYTVQRYNEIPVVTELTYYAKDKDGNEYFLGGFSKKLGFLNTQEKEFINDNQLKIISEFFSSSLKGLSIDCLNKPFSLKGIAISSNGYPYETEILCRLVINTDYHTLEEWFPDL